MMLNLFSIFDFQTFYYLNNWGSSILGLLFIPQVYWFLKSRIIYLMNELMIILFNEFIVIFKSKFNINNIIYFIILYFYMLFNNFMGLFPYIFTSSSHLVFSLTFSMSMWLAGLIYGWFKNTLHMFVHLVPQGTPFFLMFFMVLIELLSNLIRPLTLCVRLTANMIAGHLLLALLAGFIPSNLYFFIPVFFMQFMLLLLEVGVCLIQSYVFILLVILYLKETN